MGSVFELRIIAYHVLNDSDGFPASNLDDRSAVNVGIERNLIGRTRHTHTHTLIVRTCNVIKFGGGPITNFHIHLLFAQNGSKHKSNTRKGRACAYDNHSWFRVISRLVISSNNRVII